MPNKAQAEKYLRASNRRRMRNKPIRSRARTTVRDAFAAIDDANAGGDWDSADLAIKVAVRALDNAATGGVIHASNAARRKSRLLRRYNALKLPDSTQRPRSRPPEPATESATA